ncbi:MAG: HU family DNA-binding protein [Clostridia bacterium]|nr:HU family DNA-binding protein [Clostridia bacterium]
MTKNELVKAIAAKAELTGAQSAKALDAFIEAVTEALKNGDKVSLVGFGSFEIKDIPAKEGINPATGAKIQIAASKKPVLKFGKAYKESFNA